MKGFLKKNGIKLLAGILALAVLVLGGVWLARGGGQSVMGALTAARQPLVAVAESVSGWLEGLYVRLYDYDRLQAENDALRSQIADANEIARAGMDAVEENGRLSQLRVYAEQHPDFVFEAARIVSWGTDSWSNSFTIAKGEADGLEEGDCVITEDGLLVGQVEEVGENSSTVATLVDVDTSVGALVGEDGATHHGAFDIAYLRHIPQIRLLAPRDEDMLRHSLRTALNGDGPCALRYPRGAGFGVPLEGEPCLLVPGMGEVLRQGEKIAIIAVGNRAHPSLEAATLVEKELGFSPLVFDPVWLKPLPEEQLADLARRFDRLLIVEEGALAGGFSSAVLEFLNDHGLLRGQRIRRLGLPDSFVEHGKQLQLRELVGLRSRGIARAAMELAREN